MIILLSFVGLSFVTSSFVIAACALSSRISAQEEWREEFVYEGEAKAWEPVSQTSS